MNNPVGNIQNNAWEYLSFTADTASTRLYKNSSLLGTLSGSYSITPTTADLFLGRLHGHGYFVGRLDELRVASKARNRNWITTEYNNQNAPASFYQIDGAVVGQSATWSLSNWPKRVKVTVNKSQVNGSVTDFPVYVDLNGMPNSFYTDIRSDGGDIRVTASDGITPLAREVVFVNPAQTTGELWFKALSLSSTSNADFYIYYGNPSGFEPPGASLLGKNSVWSNGFVAVYHMNTLVNGNASVLDSTVYANHGTPYGGMSAGSDLVAGKTGTAIDFDGSNDMIDMNNDAELQLSTGTVSSWIKTPDAGSSYRGIAIKQAAYGHFLDSNTYIAYDWNAGANRSSGQNLADNNWHHTAFSFQSGVASGTRIYSDAVLRATSQITVLNQNVRFAIAAGTQAPTGLQLFTGNIDEVRVANKIRNRNWITTEYNNQNNFSSFATINGSVQIAASDARPQITSLYPAHRQQKVPLKANLRMTFNKNVTALSGNFVIRRYSDDFILETINFSNSLKVSGSGTSSITINPSTDLSASTDYYILIDTDSLQDAAGNRFAGISSKEGWRFRSEEGKSESLFDPFVF
jgi:hypothetical protein